MKNVKIFAVAVAMMVATAGFAQQGEGARQGRVNNPNRQSMPDVGVVVFWAFGAVEIHPVVGGCFDPRDSVGRRFPQDGKFVFTDILEPGALLNGEGCRLRKHGARPQNGHQKQGCGLFHIF